MTPATLKTAMSLLLVGTGVFHLIVAGIGAPAGLMAPLAVFGIGFFAVGVWIRSGGRTAVLIALLVAALGLTLGGSAYLQNGGPVTLPIMFVIDVLILAAGALWLMKAKSGAST